MGTLVSNLPEGSNPFETVSTSSLTGFGATWVSAPAERICVSRADARAPAEAPAELDSDWQVPVVDLLHPDVSAATQLHNAASGVGFFYVSGHGVSDECLEQQFQESEKFFALQLEDKLRIQADCSNRGYHPYGMGTAKNPYQQLDRKEAWNLYLGWESDDVGVPFHGRNLWPDAELVPGFRPAMTAYYHAMNGVAERLLRLIALGFQLPSSFFDASFDAATSNVRAIHYLAGEHSAQDGVFGVGAHTDWGMLTVLATDSVPGLQIYHAGTWRDVPPRPGCFVVNVGDMLHRWTNGRFRSTLHRVEKRTPGERYSTPFFCAPNWDATIEVLRPCVTRECPVQYPPTTCGEWLMKRRLAEYGSKPQLLIS